jgi:8-oxo-dGTP pyrophosphatase MutT (NUDIX family)
MKLVVGKSFRNNKILVQRDRDGLEYALPGGHVKIGECSIDSLIREYKEETGADIVCKRLIWGFLPPFSKVTFISTKGHFIKKCPF